MESDPPKVPDLDLFGQVIERLPQSHEWTLELVRARKPEVYRAVVACLSCQMPIRHICEQLGVSPHTVMLIRDVDAAAVATQTRAYAERLRCQSAQAAAAAMSALPEATAREAAQVSEILLNQAQILMGQPTEITQVSREPISAPAGPDRAWDAIRQAAITVPEVSASDSVSEVCDSQESSSQDVSVCNASIDTGLDTPSAGTGASPGAAQIERQSDPIAPDMEGGGVGLSLGQVEAMDQDSRKQNLPREVD